ncbi:hypothetical protein [Kitasatospora indigofera]|uniref:hypothetical protein n=1 Tax=Kitasatospora indigofera TaxID=67307 RepID=UPI0036804A62
MADLNPVVRRARIALLAEVPHAVAARVAEVLDRAGLLARPAARDNGPHPVTVRRTGLGVELGLDSLVGALFAGLLADVAEDPEGMAADAQELLDADGPERDALMDALIERHGGAGIRVGTTDAHLLAERIVTAAGPVPFPKQNNRRAA